MKLFNKFAVAAASAVMSLGVIGTSEAQAAVFTNPDTGNKYFLTEKTTWYDAQQQAVNAGGNLVTINDAAEQDWLSEVFGLSEKFWLGFTDVKQEGVFQWVSGQDVTYTNWAPGEPNDYGSGEDFTLSNWSGEKWNDMPGYTTFRGIIEVESVPEPASILGLLAVGAFGTVSSLKQKKKEVA